MSGFKSNVTDYAEIRKRWREIGSTLPEPGKKNGVDVTPKPTPDSENKAAYDYGCNGTYVSNVRDKPFNPAFNCAGMCPTPFVCMTQGSCSRIAP